MRAPEFMRAQDLAPLVRWGAEDRFAGIAHKLTRDYVAQEKFDGVRVSAAWLPGRVRLATAGAYCSEAVPLLARAAVRGLEGTVLDGEMVAPPAEDGTRAPASRIAGWLACNAAGALGYKLAYGGQPTYHVFDLLVLRGEDQTRRPYTERRRELVKVVRQILKAHPGCGLVLVPDLPATAATIDRLLDEGGEGVVLKRKKGQNRPGQRTADWLKLKATVTDIDCWLTGNWKPGKNRRAGTVGSVEVAMTAADGAPQPVGYVAVKPQMAHDYTDPDTGGLRAGLTGRVVQLTANGVTKKGMLRHPRMDRERLDKEPRHCEDVQLAALPAA